MRVLSTAAVGLVCAAFVGAFQPGAVRVGAPSPLGKSAPASFRPLSMVATGEETEVVSNLMATAAPPPPFGKVMAANRAEIAVRIVRACIELNMATGELVANACSQRMTPLVHIISNAPGSAGRDTKNNASCAQLLADVFWQNMQEINPRSVGR